ncbi:carboxypeptidase regulatory-like domain-containing protein [Myxococcus sp. MxC21-1]|uniref:carboxypeptidase regulatory-like domain-containing protein n=1 Tax=Myxococcus sp. MxC21-1 TaxID=3041439 RepID=UPI00292F6050|nr:carboxypeptidase regulatory-like domain-containing protein [Myxococcus sp. MxC21-1]WNZ60212.1 carboxypeptidase regulatory-like domain-containing protein [Myxococcus sp. MxC21-1]
MRSGGAFTILAVGVLGMLAWDARSTSEAVDRGAGVAASSQAANRIEGTGTPGMAALGSLPQSEKRRRIRGTVVDARGVPLAGVRVSAVSRAEEPLAELPCPDWAPGTGGSRSEGKPLLLMHDCWQSAQDILTEWVSSRMSEAILQAETVTDGDGTYVLDGLDVGILSVWALNEDGAAVQQGILGTHDGLQLVLAPGFRVEGTVFGEDVPLPGARISLVSVATDRYFDGIAGPDGRFHIGPLPYGHYVLLAKQDGWRPEFLHLNEATALPWGSVHLTRPLNHAGRVLSQGSPVAGARVELTAEFPHDFPFQFATSDSKGRFHFSGLRNGYGLKVSAFHEGMIASEEVTLKERNGAESVLELRPAPHFEGIVQDEARQPIPGARVSVVPERLDIDYPVTTTNLDGRFRLGPFGPDMNQVEVSAPGHLDKFVTLSSPEATSPATITLFRAVSITGVAVDAHGAPAPNVTLRLEGQCNPTGPRHNHVTTTDDAGRFELKACRAGDWGLQADNPRFLPDIASVHAPSGDLRISLKQGPTLPGIVLDEHGVPVPNADVILARREAKDTLSQNTSSDAQGHFQLGAVPPGHYTVWAQKEVLGVIRRTVAQDIELREGPPPQVELRFPEGVTVSGIVVTTSGRPLEGATITASRQSPADATEPPTVSFKCGGPFGVRTGADGRFVLRHLSSGPHTISASIDGHTFVPAQSSGGAEYETFALLVKPGEAPLRIVMQRDSQIRGRLLGPDGSPFSNFVLNNREFYVDPQDGAFKWSTLKSGVQTLRFDAPGMASRTLTVDVPFEGDVELGDIHMSPGPSILGSLLDATPHEPAESANLSP